MGKDAASWRLSPSAKTRAATCEVSDYSNYVLDIKEPQKQWHKDGELYHKQVEEWLVSGTTPTEQPPLALLNYLPRPPYPRDLVEVQIRRRSQWTGKIDLVERVPPDGIDGRGTFANLLCPVDHKFVSGLKLEGISLASALSLEDTEFLKRGAQPVIYTIALLGERAHHEASVFKWNVVDKNSLRVKPVYVYFAPGEAHALYEQYWAPVEARVRWYRTLPRLEEVMPTGAYKAYRDGCGKYGGCHYAPYCAARGIRVYPETRER